VERLLLRNPVSVQDMRDGIVDRGVYARYCNDIILLADWAAVNQLDWIPPFGLEKYSELKDETKFVHRKQTKTRWMAILKDSHNVAVFDLSQFTARQSMEYVSAQVNQKTRKPLSKAGYASKWSAFFTLFEFTMAWDQMLYLMPS
jgi:hypothetical protein